MKKEEYEGAMCRAKEYAPFDGAQVPVTDGPIVCKALLHAQAENERLRKALKPFADAGTPHNICGHGDDEDDCTIKVTCGDLRRAALGVAT